MLPLRTDLGSDPDFRSLLDRVRSVAWEAYRITSYNVCYTKLLRVAALFENSWPPSTAEGWTTMASETAPPYTLTFSMNSVRRSWPSGPNQTG